MAFNKIRGNQLQPGIIDESHVSKGAQFPEKFLAIDWDTRGDEILSKKLVIDYVQVTAINVPAGVDKIKATAKISAPVASTEEVKGAVVQAAKNKVIFRGAVTGDPVIGVAGKEVFGRLTHDGTDYFINFVTLNAAGVEVAHVITEDTVIDYQFPQRFDLLTVLETFAMNEKFVDGASDVSARLDLQQIAKDIFGTYAYSQDGEGKRTKSLAKELADETAGVTHTDVRAKTVIDEVVDARGTKANINERFAAAEKGVEDTAKEVDDIQAEILAARAGEASLLAYLEKIVKSVQDEAKARKDADDTQVEVSKALDTRLTEVEKTGGGEVKAARSSVKTGEHADLDERLEAGEALITKLEGTAHSHYAEDKHIKAGDPLIGSARYDFVTGTFVAGGRTLNVYINGALQMLDVHYTEITNLSGEGIAVSFSPELIAEGDALQFRWIK